jgi:hypothetical protein
MAMTKTPEQVGRFIGLSIAADVIREGMPREWTGLDAQDGDQIPDGMDHDEVARHAKAAYLDVLSRAAS